MDKQLESLVEHFSKTLQLIAKHEGNPLKIYSVWIWKRASFNVELLEAMPAIAAQLFVNNAEQLPYIAALMGAFGDLIQDFPLGQRWINMELSIVAYQQALTVRTKSDMPLKWAATMNNLAMAYRDRIKSNRAENLELALSACQQVLSVRTESRTPVDWARATSNLASVYLYRVQGDRAENIEQAIKNYQQALTVITKETRPDDWAQIMNDSANAYLYRIQGDQAENIEQAIYNYEQALTVRTRRKLPVEWALTLSNQGGAYQKRIRGVPAENIEQSIKAFEQALKTLTRRKRPIDWASTISNLGSAYLSRTQGSRERNIEQAIRFYKKSLAVTTQSEMPADWAETITNLASAYLQRLKGNKAENIEQAISYYQQAMTVRTKSNVPVDWAASVGNLAIAFYTRIKGDRSENVEQVIDYYQQSLTVLTPTKLPQSCRKNAQNLAILHSEQKNWTQAAEVYQTALEAAKNLYQSALLLDSRKAVLSEVTDLHRRAAYAFGRIGNLSRAVATIEQGRARSLSESLDRDRTNLINLRQMQPDLYSRYAVLTQKLRVSENQQREKLLSDDRNSITPESTRKDATIFRQELNTLVQAIRQVPGYESFLSSLTFEEIQQIVRKDCPLVYLISTPEGSLTLIVTSKDVQSILLDDLTEVQLVDWLKETWLPAASQAEEDSPSWLTAMDLVTHQLWTPLMQPLIAHLKNHGFDQATLIPTGYLSLLPLHAAWAEDETQPSSRRYALDDIHFTYAPNARSLSAARAIADRVQANSIVAIDDPRADLPNSQKEVKAAIDSFGDRTVLPHDEATVAAVKIELPKAVIAHFSCHGIADLSEPLNSGLTLHDGQLTLKDILALNLAEKGGLRLVVLSACETGVIGIENPDESVSLPTGLLQAGVAAVISTLWSVDDRSTMMLLSRFYDLWRIEGLEASQALRQAQRWLRDTTTGEKTSYFKALMVAPSAAKIPADTADYLYQSLILSDPNARDFAHPLYWAAFSYTGA